MVQVMAYTGGKKDTEITLTQDVHQAAGMDQNIPRRMLYEMLLYPHHVILHHLGDTETVAKVVKWILVIVLLYSEEKPLKSGWMDVQVLYQAQLIVHALQQGQ